jgi:hypothetical protein
MAEDAAANDDLIQGDGTGFGKTWGKPFPSELSGIYTHDRARADINALLAYNWSDEERDYYEQNPDERGGHIFATMHRINDWLNG